MSAPIAIVTGAGSGMGAATAARLSRDGARVVVVDIDADAAERVAAELPGPALAIVADVATEEGVARYTDDAATVFGPPDLAFLNAGAGGPLVPLADQAVADFDRIVAVNLRSVFLGLRAFLAAARTRTGGGAVVVTASTAGLSGSELGPYSAAKHGVVALAKAAALEGAPYGVRVNAIAPGSIGTPMMRAIETLIGGGPEAAKKLHATTPLGRAQDRYGNVEEIAATVAFLLSEAATWITGVALPIDGGVLATDPFHIAV
jgi:NAD(P)-dependent dehydrogenase (short-subunit alcohol dehydrogenase family)